SSIRRAAPLHGAGRFDPQKRCAQRMTIPGTAVPARAGNHYESQTLGQEDLQELQDRAPPARGLRHLLGPAPQAAPGVRAVLSSTPRGQWHGSLGVVNSDDFG